MSWKPGLFQFFYLFGGTRNKLEIFDFIKIVLLDVDGTVPVEKNGSTDVVIFND